MECSKGNWRKTKRTVWLCDYPKSPENEITTLSENIDVIYSTALKSYTANNICVIGDSVGGTLATALLQRLVLHKIELPAKVILVSPVMDGSLSNPEFASLEKLDPMLSKTGLLSAKKMCARKLDLKNKIISPLYGSFENFPHTVLCLAQNDIMYPVGKLAEVKLKQANVKLDVIEGNNMPHIWTFLPVMEEANISLNKIIRIINN